MNEHKCRIIPKWKGKHENQRSVKIHPNFRPSIMLEPQLLNVQLYIKLCEGASWTCLVTETCLTVPTRLTRGMATLKRERERERYIYIYNIYIYILLYVGGSARAQDAFPNGLTISFTQLKHPLGSTGRFSRSSSLGMSNLADSSWRSSSGRSTCEASESVAFQLRRSDFGARWKPQRGGGSQIFSNKILICGAACQMA